MTDKTEILGIAFLAFGVLTLFNVAMTIVLGNRLHGLINYCAMLRQYTAQLAEHVNYINGDDDDPDDGEPMPIEDDNVVPFDRKAA